MAADMDMLIETVRGGFIPGDGHNLAATIEGLPDFAEALRDGLSGLGTWMETELGAAEAEAAGRIHEAATAAAALHDAAQIAAQAFTQVSQFWLSQDG